ADGERVGAVVELDGRLIPDFGRDVPDGRDGVHDLVHVVFFELDVHAGFSATRLQCGLPREAPDDAGAEIGEDGVDGTAESVAVSDEQHDCRNSPSHAQHGERGPAAIELQCVDGLCDDVANHV